MFSPAKLADVQARLRPTQGKGLISSLCPVAPNLSVSPLTGRVALTATEARQCGYGCGSLKRGGWHIMLSESRLLDAAWLRRAARSAKGRDTLGNIKVKRPNAMHQMGR